ncbi:H-2 class II histocompatibility antigen, A-U alpha chain-like [Cheilinus undulatus]|uniref:H-2 class II histocompatibility antigen, A-U alpha chain-like n=1 Tax=Cheilinus undulatus TaxID=241271 RepID=UPI001BD34DC8|nr:H-2 class II histocompatibility antigen, A-U alpha chain-like [Cheilinus undulatus]
MRQSALLILMLNSFCALSQIPHKAVYVVGCFDNCKTQVQYEFDSEEFLYMDFERDEVVYSVPPFLLLNPSEVLGREHVHKDALKAKKACSTVYSFLKGQGIHPPEEKDPPESVLYPADEVQLNVENSLICYVNHFYPPEIKVSWTKNGRPVSEGALLSRYYPNKDQTFHQFSTLKFTPKEGDVYSCTVEHVALEQPRTKIWASSTDLDVSHPHLGPDVVCGAGLMLGLLGIAGGTFFVVKGRHARQ